MIQFEVHTKTSPRIEEVAQYWLMKWQEILLKLDGTRAERKNFEEYDFFYVLRVNHQIAAVMSSAHQSVLDNLIKDPYYQALPDINEILIKFNISQFQKMGMIAADLAAFPKDFKLTRIIVGCGLKFVNLYHKETQAVVSFPRTDTSVYSSCIEWGAVTAVDQLQMHNVPVSFIIVKREDFTHQHLNNDINDKAEKLFLNGLYFNLGEVKSLVQGGPKSSLSAA